jgi:hypothetical protein
MRIADDGRPGESARCGKGHGDGTLPLRVCLYGLRRSIEPVSCHTVATRLTAEVIIGYQHEGDESGPTVRAASQLTSRPSTRCPAIFGNANPSARTPTFAPLGALAVCSSLRLCAERSRVPSAAPPPLAWTMSQCAMSSAVLTTAPAPAPKVLGAGSSNHARHAALLRPLRRPRSVRLKIEPIAANHPQARTLRRLTVLR